MSDLEKVDIMLGIYSRNDKENEQYDCEVNLNSESNMLQGISNLIGEDCRSLLNVNSRENSERKTIETTRMISDEIKNQVARRLNEIKLSLNSQIQDAIGAAIAEKVLHSIQNTLRLRRELISP